MILELFGDFEMKIRVSLVFPPCKLLTKIGYFTNDREDRKSLFVFLVNSMKSTWAQVRIHSFNILILFPDDYESFNDHSFVNNVLLPAASALANNPKAMMAEASALFHNLLFRKCLKQIDVIPAEAKHS